MVITSGCNASTEFGKQASRFHNNLTDGHNKSHAIFLLLASGSLAMIFRLRWPWRFTLRSLFIVTTFLAVVLGMIAWLDRAWIGK